jgi:hypothetical protein
MPNVFLTVSIGAVLLYLATLGTGYVQQIGWLAAGTHMLVGFFMALLMVLLQCLIFGFFIGSGKSVKRVVEEYQLDAQWNAREKEFKNRLYPWLMIAIVAMMAAAIVGAGVAAGAIALWIHQVSVWAALGLNLVALWKSYQVIVENVHLIHDINQEVQKKISHGGITKKTSPATSTSSEITTSKPVQMGPLLHFIGLTLIALVVYMKVVMGQRNFPWIVPLILAGVCFGIGWWIQTKTKLK